MKYNKIHVFLRMFANNRINPDRPTWFDYEKNFKSFLNTTNFQYAKLTICFEGNLTTHFLSKYQGLAPFEIVHINTVNSARKTAENAGWSKSVAATSEVMKAADNDSKTLYYILEDDYLHYWHWIESSLNVFNNYLDDNSYVCLYDHADKYLFRHPTAADHWGMYRDLKSEIIVSESRHWRTVPNCGMSMIMPKDLFERDYEFWSLGESDCDIGYHISKKHRTKIWTPMPAIATHCVNPFISPLINWEAVLERTI